ncbi:unnamed protein product [Durusdinium trenchii]|uniref:Uncharacterized protein n=1 Tax=Durusdinium trenchii TaxID=1381693 RepID=A0ABP0N306_9DINO
MQRLGLSSCSTSGVKKKRRAQQLSSGGSAPEVSKWDPPQVSSVEGHERCASTCELEILSRDPSVSGQQSNLDATVDKLLPSLESKNRIPRPARLQKQMDPVSLV